MTHFHFLRFLVETFSIFFPIFFSFAKIIFRKFHEIPGRINYYRIYIDFWPGSDISDKMCQLARISEKVVPGVDIGGAGLGHVFVCSAHDFGLAALVHHLRGWLPIRFAQSLMAVKPNFSRRTRFRQSEIATSRPWPRKSCTLVAVFGCS